MILVVKDGEQQHQVHIQEKRYPIKRFYCTICKRVRRARVLPQSVISHVEGGREIGPQDRVGQCRWHGRGDGMSRAAVTSRVRVVKHLGSTRKTSASAAKSKSKK